MQLFISKLIELAQTSADTDQTPEEFQIDLDSQMNRVLDVVPADAARQLQDLGAEGFELETANSENARAAVRDLANERIRESVIAFRNTGNYVFPEGYSRCFRSSMRIAGDPIQNDETNRTFLGKLNSPDPHVKHEAFLELMDRFSQATPDVWAKYTDKELAENAGDILPLANMAFEAQNMFGYFKDAGVPITPEEEKRWDTLTGKIGEGTTLVNSRLNLICNPCYPKMDYRKLPMDTPEFWQDTVDAALEGEADDYLSDARQYYNSVHLVAIQNSIYNELGRENLQGGPLALKFNYAPTFDPEMPDGKNYDPSTPEKDGPAGKPLFVYDEQVKDRLVNAEKDRLRSEAEAKHWSEGKLKKELNDSKKILKRVSDANPDKFFCVQDLAGNGVYTRVPKPVKKPNRFFRFLHNVGKRLGTNGLSRCNEYDQYENQINELRAQAAKRTTFDGFRKAAEEQEKAHKEVSDSYRSISSTRKAMREAETRFTDLLGPRPKDNQILLQREVYKQGDLDLTEYQLRDGFTEEEFATAAFAALSNTELTKDLRGEVPGLNDEDRSKQCYPHLTEDLLYKDDWNSRPRSSRFIQAYGGARKMAKDAFDAYAARNKEPLARLLGDSIPRQLNNANPDTEFSNVTCEAAKCLGRELRLLNRDPELMRLSGLKEEDIRNARAMIKMGELFENRLRAGEMLKEAADGKRELSPQERQHCIEDVLIYQMVEHRERLDRLHFENNDPGLKQLRDEQMSKYTEITQYDSKKEPEKIAEVNAQVQVLQFREAVQRGQRPQTALLKTLSDPANGPAAMSQLRERIRNSSAMKELQGKNAIEQMTFAGARLGFENRAKELYQEVFPAKAETSKVGARQRSKSVSVPKNEGLGPV